MGMPRTARILPIAIILLFLPIAAVAVPIPDIYQKLVDELRPSNPAAADTLALAFEKRMEDHQAALALFTRVCEMAPQFSAAKRHQGYELMALDRRDEALVSMRAATNIEESAWNLLGLAMALSVASPGSEPTKEDLRQAAQLMQRVETMEPEDTQVAFSACDLAARTGDLDWLGRTVGRVQQLAPKDPWTGYFTFVHLAMKGDLAGAKESLEDAREHGLPENVYTQAAGMLKGAQPPWERYGPAILIVLGAWLAGFLLFLGVGTILSGAALHASKRLPTEESGRAVGMDAGLRKAYSWVLWACCAYYCVSIPLVVAAVLVTGGGLIYAIFMTGHIPIKLVALIGILTLVTLWAIVKSLLLRRRDEDPGLKVGEGEHPRLRAVLDAVAKRIGTRPVTNVYLTPGAEMAVMERGGVYKQFSGQAERCLILGVATLEGMKMRPFRSILAHEYGHFSNRDTAGGGFALAVRQSLVATAVNLARSGAAGWYNPAWLFVNGFYRLFLRISQGASRLQEVLADRWAAFAYGAAAFRQGLTHVIERSIRFDAHANSVLEEVVEGKKALANLYTYRPAATTMDAEKLGTAIDQAVHRDPSPYDSHPRPVDRFAWVEALGSVGGPAEADDQADVWSLFDDREAVERLLTDTVRQNISAQGVEIPREDDPLERSGT
jgi:Zn-dependent protease with chaperone function